MSSKTADVLVRTIMSRRMMTRLYSMARANFASCAPFRLTSYMIMSARAGMDAPEVSQVNSFVRHFGACVTVWCGAEELLTTSLRPPLPVPAAPTPPPPPPPFPLPPCVGSSLPSNSSSEAISSLSASTRLRWVRDGPCDWLATPDPLRLGGMLESPRLNDDGVQGGER